MVRHETGGFEFIHRRHGVLDITGAFGQMDDLGFGTGEPDDLTCQIVDGDFSAVSDVVDAGEFALREKGVGSNDIFDKDEIAGLFAVTEDGEVFVVQRLFDENGNGGGVGAFGVLPGPKTLK